MNPLQFEPMAQEALRLYSNGNVTDAERICSEILAAKPNYFLALLLLGTIARETSRPEFAYRLLSTALKEKPRSPEAHLNFGIVMSQSNNWQESLAHFEKAIRFKPGWAPPHYFLGEVLLRAGDSTKAKLALRRALSIDPAMATTVGLLADALLSEQRYADTLCCLRLVDEHAMHDPDTIYKIAATLQLLSRPQEAKVEYDRLNTLLDPNRWASSIKTTYDVLAPNYDADISEDSREAYRVLLDCVKSEIAGQFENTIDLGCGTGAGAELLRPISRHLIGVDFSSEMIRRAKSLGLYDEMVASDIINYLCEQAVADSFDLIVAVGSFVHLGELDGAFEGCARALKSGGMLGFDILHHEGKQSGLDETAGIIGVFEHAPSYVLASATTAGLELVTDREVSAQRGSQDSKRRHFMLFKRP